MHSISEEDLCCPICTGIYRNPVVLSCSHSFCKICIQKWWQGKKERECPCCKRKSSKSDPPNNLALRNLCEAFLSGSEQRESAGLCKLHSEKLRLFCLDHQQPVCLVCRESKMHKQHEFRPIDEAAQDHRVKLQIELTPLQEKLALFEEFKEKYDQTAKHMVAQAQQTEEHIKEQFKKLHQFLQEEEETRIAALRDEQDQKNQLLKGKIQVLSRNISVLSDVIRATETELRAEDVPFLNNYKAAVERVQQLPHLQDPKLISGVLIDEVNHVGNLAFNIWKKMKQVVSWAPVILDPNTADPELKVSADLRIVKAVKQQKLPANPERTKYSCSVLGSQGFNSGSHSWEIYVGNNKDWELGVLGDQTGSNGRLQSRLWRILFSDGKLTAFSSSDVEKHLTVKTKLEKVRVHLDFGRGKLSFSNSDTETHLHTFMHKFSDTVFPYIYTESPQPLKILPAKVSVTVECV
ncbi:tripartite motif-containing protein 35-like isoform X1 [Salarias fasciatus]|nr:tripartite motif-containing protein 35-like isoform X1 [Salarias fasciatus]